MKKISKRFLSLFLVLSLTMLCSMSVFAAEPEAEVTQGTESTSTSDNSIMPMATDWLFAMWPYEISQTSKTYSSFVSTGRAKMTAELSVDAPCILYIGLLRSDGSSLGYMSMNATSAGTCNFNLNPQYLNAGSYQVVFWFDRSNVTYSLYLHGTTAN